MLYVKISFVRLRVLLLLPTSTYRTHDFMQAAEKLDVAVVVASEEASTMEPLVKDSLLTLDFARPDHCAQRVSDFHERFPIHAVIAVDEDTAVVASAIGARLGLPHNDRDAVVRARLKHSMRGCLKRAGIASPSYRTIEVAADGSEVEALGRELSFPAVLKPVFLSGSRGVVRVDDGDALIEALGRLKRLLSEPALILKGGAHASTVLIEDFVSGPEVALEAIVTEGKLEPLALFDKPDPLDGPYFEETLYVTPSRLPDPVQRRVVEQAAAAAAALGLMHGPVHAELRLSDEASPVVIEIAGRSIGGLCSRTLRFGLGLSLEELILRHALGENIDAMKRERQAAGVMMVPIPESGTLEGVEGVETAERVTGVDSVTITASLGSRLVPLPEGSSYLGFIFARAESPEKVERALRQAHGELRFAIR